MMKKSSQKYDKGIIYIAGGDEYVQAAAESARRVKDLCSVDICIICSAGSVPDVFDYTVCLENMDYSFRDKVEYISQTPFEKTIFFDADTWLVSESGITDLFEMLDYVDLAAALDNNRVSNNPNIEPPDLPESLPMVNTGVIAFRDTQSIMGLFEEWLELYDGYGTRACTDQPAFREAIAVCNVRYSILPREYNFIISSSQTVSSDVKLLHGDAANYQEITTTLNRSSWETPRYYQPLYTSSPPPSKDRRIIPRLGTVNKPGVARLTVQSIREIGIIWTVLCWAAGGPAVGRSRLELLRGIIEEDGWRAAVEKVIRSL